MSERDYVFHSLFLLVFSQYTGASEKEENGWAKLDNGLVVVWGNGNAWNNYPTTGPCRAVLPIKMKSIYSLVGNVSNNIGAIDAYSLSEDGLQLNASWDSLGSPAHPTAWHYIAIGIPADNA